MSTVDLSTCLYLCCGLKFRCFLQVNEELYKQFGGERHIKAVYHPDVMSLDQKCESETTK